VNAHPTEGEDDDARWLAALAGRPLPGTAAATAAEAVWLRRVVTSAAAPEWLPDESPRRVAARRERLVERARAAGLLAERPAAPGWRSLWGWMGPCRWCARFEPPGWAGAVALALLLAAGAPTLWQQALPGPARDEDATLRAAAPLQRVVVGDPLRSRSELGRQLTAAGAQVVPYERAGRPGLDAEWPAAARIAVAEVLVRAGLLRPAGAGDELLIEFEPMGGGRGDATTQGVESGSGR
jgi:hypothetical protein